jgi:integrase
MAGKVKLIKIDTREARAKLEARGQPYYAEVLAGLSLGYRKGLRRSRWVTRRWVGDAYVVTTLDGVVDDAERANGVEILSFDQAKRKALELADAPVKETGLPQRRKAKAAPYTVADAITAYLSYLDRETKSGPRSRAFANTSILPQLGHIALRDLTKETLTDWLYGLAASPRRTRAGVADAPVTDDEKRKRRNSANRVWGVLSAALNLAFADGHIDTDAGWKRVRPLREATAARVRRFTAGEARALVEAAEEPFRSLLIAGLHTGARYGELARLVVGDFEEGSDSLLIRVSKSGKSRHVVLTREASGFFNRLCAGRSPREVMLTRAGGLPWGAGHQARPMERCCARAGVKHGGFNVCRHSYTSAAVEDHVPLMVIAQNLGHRDISMLQKHYAHIADEHRREMIQGRMTRLGFDDDGGAR